MNKWLNFSPFILLLTLACSTHYEVALKHFNRANNAYKDGQLGRTIKEYDQALETFKDVQPQPLNQLLQSVIYHQIYLINPLVVWQKLDKKTQAQNHYISKIISDQLTAKSPDFLSLAFLSIINSEEMLRGIDLPKKEEWLLIEKNIIAGDLLVREANSEEDFMTKKGISDVVPDEFITKLKRFSFYDLALTFYFEAWIKTISFLYRYPSINLQWLTELSQKRLREVCWSLVSITTALSYLDRSNEFQYIFRQKSSHYLEVIKQIELISLPLSSDALSSEDKIGKLVGLKHEKNYLVLNATYHFNEARIKLSTALEEILAQKNTVLPYFLDALKDISLVRILSKVNNLSYSQPIHFLTDDIYFSLYRLSE
jgi:hypothetical protein